MDKEKELMNERRDTDERVQNMDEHTNRAVDTCSHSGSGLVGPIVAGRHVWLWDRQWLKHFDGGD